MVFTVLEKWCKDVKGEYIFDFLDVGRTTWYGYKRNNELPLMVCKIICYEFGQCITDDLGDIAVFVVEGYNKEVE